jgi:bifunctional polynucleotide phosphatase/kinase
MWWDASVPERLKREWEEGKHLVALSNQGGERPKVQEEWKAKLPLIAAKVCHLLHLHSLPTISFI